MLSNTGRAREGPPAGTGARLVCPPQPPQNPDLFPGERHPLGSEARPLGSRRPPDPARPGRRRSPCPKDSKTSARPPGPRRIPRTPLAAAVDVDERSGPLYLVPVERRRVFCCLSGRLLVLHPLDVGGEGILREGFFWGHAARGLSLTLDDATPGISLFRRIFCRRKKDENQIFGAIKNRG